MKETGKHGAGRLTKAQAIGMFTNQAELAQRLGLTRGAVTNWRDDRPIPASAELKLREVVCPERFRTSRRTVLALIKEL